MTLLGFEGFDNFLTFHKPGLLWVLPNANPANVAGVDGSTNGAVQTSANNTAFVACTFAATSNPVVGFHFKQNTLTDTTNMHIISFYSGGSGGTQQLTLRLRLTGIIEVYRGGPAGTLLGTGTHPLTANNWYHIQVKALIHASTGSVEVKLNGATEITVPVANTGSAAIDTVLVRGAGGSLSTFFDNLWICDNVDATATQGLPNNDYLGELKAVTLVPTGAGDSSQWTASVGTNWSTLDENPPTTTDYVENSSSDTGERDLYTMSDLPALAGTVYAMDSRLYAAKTDLGYGWAKQVIKESSVVTALSSDPVPLVTPDVVGSTFITKRPSDGTPLSVADINSMQVGIEVG